MKTKQTKLTRIIGDLTIERDSLLARVANFDRAIQELKQAALLAGEDPLEGLELAPRESETRALSALQEEYEGAPPPALALVRNETPPPPPGETGDEDPAGTVRHLVEYLMKLKRPLSALEIHERLTRQAFVRWTSASNTRTLLKKAVNGGQVVRTGTRGSYRYAISA